MAWSMAAGGWAAWPREGLAPRRAWMAERMKEKVRQHLSHQSVVQYMDDPTSEQAWRPGVCRNRLPLSPGHSSCGRENKWSKRRVLHLAYPLFIGSFFLLLMFSVTGGRRLVLVRGGMGVEDSHIKKCLFKSPTPLSIC